MIFSLNFNKEDFKLIECDITDNIINLKNVPSHSNLYEYKDFTIRDNEGPISFYIELISYTEINIILNKTPNLDNGLFIDLSFYNITRTEKLDNTFSYIKTEPATTTPDTTIYLDIPNRNLSTIPMNTPKDKQVDEWLLGFNVLFDDELKSTYLTANVIGTFNTDNYKEILIEKFELEIFDDFPIKQNIVEFEKDELGNTINKILYDFEQDYVYKVSFFYKDKEYNLNYIHNKPSIYYSSINHIKKALKGKGLDYIGTDFELKIKIWQLSNLAHSKAGLIKTYEVPLHKQSVLSEFIALKICYDILKGIINNISFNDDEFSKQAKLSSITITDYSSSLFGKTPYEILVSTYKEYYKELKEYENKIEDIFYNTLLPDSKLSFKSTNSVIKSNRQTFSERW